MVHVNMLPVLLLIRFIKHKLGKTACKLGTPKTEEWVVVKLLTTRTHPDDLPCQEVYVIVEVSALSFPATVHTQSIAARNSENHVTGTSKAGSQYHRSASSLLHIHDACR